MKIGFLLWRGKEHGNASFSVKGFTFLVLCFLGVVNLGGLLGWVLGGLKLKTWKKLGVGFGGKRSERDETEFSMPNCYDNKGNGYFSDACLFGRTLDFRYFSKKLKILDMVWIEMRRNKGK